MYTETEMRSLYQCFAHMLEYPAGGALQAALKARGLLLDKDPASAAQLKEFYDYAATLSPGRLEEVYTGTFDLDAACHPYVGYHLFGETYKRSIFLVELKQRYAAEGFVFPDNELPDHLAVILRFLSVARDETQAQEIARDALLPVLDRMTGRAKSAGFDEDENPDAPKEESKKRTQFHGVLEALRSILQIQFQVLNVLETTA
ncbi:MAG TPA: nitrate reductase molybdenum cofactor assembly chaperone [Anaerolineales bacterium]|jgi:nitrate reductase delta subunit|nr:nitrate reductase molybdenum cofactor assembly chaperone [Anaerolineales bacterium]